MDAAAILKGALLPFGGYKGAAIALMIELLAGPLIGETTSLEAQVVDNNDADRHVAANSFWRLIRLVSAIPRPVSGRQKYCFKRY